MNITEHLLTVLSEECSEVAKECSKALRFGLDDKLTTDPKGPRGAEGPTNAEKIETELNDLFAVADMLAKRGIIKRYWFSEMKQAVKKRKVLDFMKYAQRVGALRQ